MHNILELDLVFLKDKNKEFYTLPLEEVDFKELEEKFFKAKTMLLHTIVSQYLSQMKGRVRAFKLSQVKRDDWIIENSLHKKAQENMYTALSKEFERRKI